MKKNEKQNQNGGQVKVVAKKEKFAKLKGSLKRNGSRVIAIGLTAVVIVGAFHISKNNNKNNTNNPTKPTTSQGPTNPTTNPNANKVEQYSRELLDERVDNFVKDAEAKGIELTEEEVREFAGFMNIDVIINEDPELAKELFGDKNAEEVLSDAGHTIGKIMTKSATSNYKNTMNLSNLVVGNDYDKAILSKLEAYRDELTAMRAEEVGEHRVEFATKEEQDRFNAIINEVLNFYSMTVNGLTLDGKTGLIQNMGDGNRFPMVLVMNEIALGNKNLLTKEQYQAFQNLMKNEPVVANLITMIDGCKTKTK